MLLNVENAYWNLYGSYYQLYSREQGLRFAYETWKITGRKFRVGRVSRAALAQAEGQYNLFRSQRLQAIDTVLDNERQLRAMLGMQIEDGTRLVPSDAPTLAEYRPDWKTGWYEAMQNRPELYIARQDVKVAQLNVQLAKNYLMPDLRSFMAYDTNAIGSRLDGNGPLNAFRNLASNTYNDWTVGLRLGMPLGLPLRPCSVASDAAATGPCLPGVAGSGTEGRAFPWPVLSPYVVGVLPDQGGTRPA